MMETPSNLKDTELMRQLLIDSMAELDEDAVLLYVQQAIEEGLSPRRIVDAIRAGMEEVGRRYEEKEYFVSELLMSGLIFSEVIDMEYISGCTDNSYKENALLLLGTVRGDLHDIGKNIFASLAKAAGFRVVDLGVDVPDETFIKKIKELHPDIVGLSGVMSFAQDNMKTLIDKIKEEGLRDKLKIIAGGATFCNNPINSFIGADTYSTDAWEGVEICKKWAKEKGK